MSGAAEAIASSGAKALLERLCSAECKVDCRGVMVVVAHPDDEAIALGGQLSRMEGLRLLHVTDGAPLNMSDALACGFSRREEYADARRKELTAALAIAGLGPGALISLGAADQSVAFRMAELARRLAEILHEEDVRTVITHAYEGGHPDHDATAFVVHAACRLLARRGLVEPEVIEFPLYHAHEGVMIVQDFAPGEEREGACAISLGKSAADVKRRMFAKYVTQRRTLAAFVGQVERFQPAPKRNFGAMPNRGDLFYSHFDWGLRPTKWAELVAQARRDLDLPQWL